MLVTLRKDFRYTRLEVVPDEKFNPIELVKVKGVEEHFVSCGFDINEEIFVTICRFEDSPLLNYIYWQLG